MTIKKALVSFFFLYLALLISASVAVSFLGIDAGSSINIGVLVGCVFWVCSTYGKKNGKYFEGKEKTKIVLGFSAINILIQFLLSLTLLPSGDLSTVLVSIIIAVVFIGIIHSLVVYFLVGMCKKMLIKNGTING